MRKRIKPNKFRGRMQLQMADESVRLLQRRGFRRDPSNLTAMGRRLWTL